MSHTKDHGLTEHDLSSLAPGVLTVNEENGVKTLATNTDGTAHVHDNFSLLETISQDPETGRPYFGTVGTMMLGESSGGDAPVLVTIATSDWSSKTYTYSCTVPDLVNVSIGLPCPTTAANVAAIAATEGIWLSSVAANGITFTCKTAPTAAVTLAVRGVEP